MAPDADILGVEEDGFLTHLRWVICSSPVMSGRILRFRYLSGAGAPGRQFLSSSLTMPRGNDIFGESFTRPLLTSPVPEPSPQLVPARPAAAR